MMTRDQFLDWVGADDARYEFDGIRPVAMPPGNATHSRIARNLLIALSTRLEGTAHEALGLDIGVATIGEAVRVPDAVVFRGPVKGTCRLVPNPLLVFEVISPHGEHVDRIVKVREYAAVPSIRRYVIVETDFVGLTVLDWTEAGQAWTAGTLIEGDRLQLPELGIEIPVAEIYEDIDFPPSGTAGAR